MRARLHRAPRTRFFQARIGLRADAEARDAPLLNFAAKPLGTEWLIVVSNIPARKALHAYRKRWAIECLFGDAKTRGLNIEDTRITDPRKLALLMALAALAIVCAGRVAIDRLGSANPKRKAHGYFAQSCFRVGFDNLRNLLAACHEHAVRPWRRLQQNDRKQSRTARVV